MAKASAANDFVHEPGLTMEETAKRYSVWAQSAKYEKDLSEANYKGPVITADVIAKYFPDHNSRSNAYILDVAAGSGFVGEKLAVRVMAVSVSIMVAGHFDPRHFDPQHFDPATSTPPLRPRGISTPRHLDPDHFDPADGFC